MEQLRIGVGPPSGTGSDGVVSSSGYLVPKSLAEFTVGFSARDRKKFDFAAMYVHYLEVFQDAVVLANSEIQPMPARAGTSSKGSLISGGSRNRFAGLKSAVRSSLSSGSVASVRSLQSVSGYCYLSTIVHDKHELASKICGQWPSFEKYLSLPADYVSLPSLTSKELVGSGNLVHVENVHPASGNDTVLSAMLSVASNLEKGSPALKAGSIGSQLHGTQPTRVGRKWRSGICIGGDTFWPMRSFGLTESSHIADEIMVGWKRFGEQPIVICNAMDYDVTERRAVLVSTEGLINTYTVSVSPGTWFSLQYGQTVSVHGVKVDGRVGGVFLGFQHSVTVQLTQHSDIGFSPVLRGHVNLNPKNVVDYWYSEYSERARLAVDSDVVVLRGCDDFCGVGFELISHKIDCGVLRYKALAKPSSGEFREHPETDVHLSSGKLEIAGCVRLDAGPVITMPSWVHGWRMLTDVCQVLRDTVVDEVVYDSYLEESEGKLQTN